MTNDVMIHEVIIASRNLVTLTSPGERKSTFHVDNPSRLIIKRTDPITTVLKVTAMVDCYALMFPQRMALVTQNAFILLVSSLSESTL